MDELRFTIPLNPVSKKNSQQIVRAGSRPKIIPSKRYKEYEREAAAFIPFVAQPIDCPVEVSAQFYMKTRGRVDLPNLLEALDDVLVKHGILADDNSRIIVSHDGSRVLYDKEHPRTEVVIRPMEDGVLVPSDTLTFCQIEPSLPEGHSIYVASAECEARNYLVEGVVHDNIFLLREEVKGVMQKEVVTVCAPKKHILLVLVK